MSLTLIATPIGNPADITLRALETLKTADIYIGEERKPMFRLLKQLGVSTPEKFELLNEHSSPEEIKALSSLCKNNQVVLMSDCGTPGFNDPGAELVALCRAQGIEVTSNPGPSSLTTLLSLSGVKLTNFNYFGFLPRTPEEREQALKSIAKSNTPTIIMDTPYRLKKTISECEKYLPNNNFVLGMDFTKENEEVICGSISNLVKNYDGQKREFLLLIY